MITSLVVACSANEVIGRDGDLPWHLPEDLRHFRRLTSHHAVVVGRVTHDSIVARLGRPLPNRVSVVISGSPGTGDEATEQVIRQPSFESALRAAEAAEEALGGDEVFVIGGASVYRQALPFVDRIYLTRVDLQCEGDSRMPDGWTDGFDVVERDDGYDEKSQISYSFLRYQRAGQ
ncbi:dihydrofolate reductase [Streptacidiphilus sp. MAP12-16]|uniref:dihydrofolate reductase n=1 Tax=Streptacidiphilus sp. MAP12-16 TaxID=3156300 RepID=UPI003512C4BC